MRSRFDPSGVSLAICRWHEVVLAWIIGRRLNKRGYFIQPDSGLEAIAEIESHDSPVKAFVRDSDDDWQRSYEGIALLREAPNKTTSAQVRASPGVPLSFYVRASFGNRGNTKSRLGKCQSLGVAQNSAHGRGRGSAHDHLAVRYSTKNRGVAGSTSAGLRTMRTAVNSGCASLAR
jgi:hypothetical protein